MIPTCDPGNTCIGKPFMLGADNESIVTEGAASVMHIASPIHLKPRHLCKLCVCRCCALCSIVLLEPNLLCQLEPGRDSPNQCSLWKKFFCWNMFNLGHYNSATIQFQFNSKNIYCHNVYIDDIQNRFLTGKYSVIHQQQGIYQHIMTKGARNPSGFMGSKSETLLHLK